MKVIVRIFNCFGLLTEFETREGSDVTVDMFANAEADWSFEFDYPEGT